jgi:hypothetical protein
MLALSNCVEELQQTSGDNTNRATGLSKPDTPENKSEVKTYTGQQNMKLFLKANIAMSMQILC